MVAEDIRVHILLVGVVYPIRNTNHRLPKIATQTAEFGGKSKAIRFARLETSGSTHYPPTYIVT